MGYPQIRGPRDEPVPHSYINGSDGVSLVFGGMALPGYPQKWVPRDLKMGYLG